MIRDVLIKVSTAILGASIVLAGMPMIEGEARKSASPVSVSEPIKPFGSIAVWARDCISPCYLPVEFAGGGEIKAFMSAAIQLRHKEFVVRTNICASACTMLIDQLNEWGSKVCANRNTVMGFHHASQWGKVLADVQLYKNPFLVWWLADNPGILPEDGTMLFMSSSEWGYFWPVCADLGYKTTTDGGYDSGKLHYLRFLG